MLHLITLSIIVCALLIISLGHKFLDAEGCWISGGDQDSCDLMASG